MKLLLLLFVFLISLASYAGEDTINPRDWQPVIGAKKSPTVSIFFDRNNHSITRLDNGDYVNGSILFVSTIDVLVEVEGKKISTRSMMKNYVVDCNTGMALAYADYFFNVPKPLATTESVAARFRDIDSAAAFDKNSLIYHLFCPKYI
jgi:hypothetical protein